MPKYAKNALFRWITYQHSYFLTVFLVHIFVDNCYFFLKLWIKHPKKQEKCAILSTNKRSFPLFEKVIHNPFLFSCVYFPYSYMKKPPCGSTARGLLLCI